MAEPQTEPIPVDIPAERQAAADLAKLIRKLRWIGMEEEARQLQVALSRFPSEQRAPVVSNVTNTD
jgi:hypothetical protein